MNHTQGAGNVLAPWASPMPPLPRKTIFPIATAMLGFFAMLLMYLSTPVGAGLANDSVAYIAGARSILQGTGYSDIWLDSSLEPITHYPPLLSIVLSAIGFGGVDPLRAVRWLNIFLFGANTLLVVLLAKKVSGNRWLGLWAGGLFVLSPSLLRVSLFAMSEPLYLALSLGAFWLFFKFIEGKGATLLWAGCAVGFAILTRYSGMALLPALWVVLLLLPGSFGQKLKQAIGFTLPSIALLGLWLLRNRLVAGNITNRTLQAHPISPDQLQSGAYNLSRMLIPFEPTRLWLVRSELWDVLFWILLVSLVAGLAWFFYQELKSNTLIKTQAKLAALLLYIFSYFGALFFSISFFDNSTRLIDRILAPAVVTLLILAAGAAQMAWAWLAAQQNKGKKIAGMAGFLGLLALAMILSAAGQAGAVRAYSSEGQGYASWKWHDSKILAAVREAPTGMAIYTNTPPAVYLVTGRASRVMPTQIDPVSNTPRAEYDSEMRQMAEDVKLGKAVLALFNTKDLEGSPDQAGFEPYLSGLPILEKSGDATLFGVSLP